MTDRPDFEKLRAERDQAVDKAVRAAQREMGAPETGIAAHVSYGGGTKDYYCACADGGPCEHEFSGWREFEDGSGGEQFCQRCGMGAMAHTVNTCWD